MDNRKYYNLKLFKQVLALNMIETKEILRQIFHIILGIIVVELIHNGILNSLILLVFICLGIIISILSKFRKLPIVSWFLDKFERAEKMKSFPGKGALFFFIGCLFSLVLFRKDIALASIMILTLGDSFSTLIGKSVGKIRLPYDSTQKKSLEGSLTGVLMGFFGALLFINNYYIAFAGAFIGMLMESFSIRISSFEIDDNLIVPLACGAMMTLLYLI